jgi:hypothetical protein
MLQEYITAIFGKSTKLYEVDALPAYPCYNLFIGAHF